MPGKYWPLEFHKLPADQAFVVGMPFVVNGRQYQPGEPFDRALVTTRLLGILYEGRRLRPAPPQEPQHDQPNRASQGVQIDSGELEAGRREADAKPKPGKLASRSRTSLAR